MVHIQTLYKYKSHHNHIMFLSLCRNKSLLLYIIIVGQMIMLLNTEHYNLISVGISHLIINKHVCSFPQLNYGSHYLLIQTYGWFKLSPWQSCKYSSPSLLWTNCIRADSIKLLSIVQGLSMFKHRKDITSLFSSH